jgi:hypothetical protein
MPTVNPRIQVTIKPSQYRLLKNLAKLRRLSMSRVLSELFDEIEPVYERVAVVLQAAVRAQSSATAGMRHAFEKAEGEMAPHVAAAMGQLDLLVAQAQGDAPPPASASTASGAGSAGTPASVTRGSGLPNTPIRAGTIPPSVPIVSPRKSRTALRFRNGERKSSGRSVRPKAKARGK